MSIWVNKHLHNNRFLFQWKTLCLGIYIPAYVNYYVRSGTPANIIACAAYWFFTHTFVQYLWPFSSAEVTTLLTLLLFFILIFCPVPSPAMLAYAAYFRFSLEVRCVAFQSLPSHSLSSIYCCGVHFFPFLSHSIWWIMTIYRPGLCPPPPTDCWVVPKHYCCGVSFMT